MNKIIANIVIWTTFIIFFGRLFVLQVVRHDDLMNIVEDETIEAIHIDAERGYIYDRNMELIVANQLAYNVSIIPNNIKPFDTLELCQLLNTNKEHFLKLYDKACQYSRIKPYTILNQLSKKDYATLKEKLRNFKGFYIKKRSQRYYNKHIGANFLGYIGEVSTRDLKKNKYYVLGNYVGKQGIEKQYENILRGKKGVKYLQKDRFNRKIGSYKNSIYDTIPEKGKDIRITIDSELQAYGELLMKNKRGGIVAIEPHTGEILALVSSPSFDPALLTGRDRSKNYTRLYNDSVAKPLYDRGLLAMYPPGSTFKPLNTLVYLQENIINPRVEIVCYGGYKYGRNAFMKCHCIPGTRNNLVSAIYRSCNSYMASLYRKLIEKYPTAYDGLEAWRGHVESFGLGNFLGYDLPIGKKGKVPSGKYYDRVYGKSNWKSNYTISNSIGQGEILTTPIQLANMMTVIANRGSYYTPHIMKFDKGDPAYKKYQEKKISSINPEYFEAVIQGLKEVYTKGTARNLRVNGIEIAGKTGTAENYIKINGKRTQLTDHSIFTAFAPADNPKIAIAVFIENGYWGSRFAGPIVSLCIEKYLKNKITRTDLEYRMLHRSLEKEYQKPISGNPFKINQDEYK